MTLPGGYIRTNYRRSVAQVSLDAIGGGYPKSSQYTGGTGPGTKTPYGGFMFLNRTAIIQSDAADASVAGISGCVVDSTYDLMLSYYGAGNFDSGYAFLPVFVHPLSIYSAAVEWCASAGQGTDSFYMARAISLRFSGSCWAFKPILMAHGAASVWSCMSLATHVIAFQIGGFIISTP